MIVNTSKDIDKMIFKINKPFFIFLFFINLKLKYSHNDSIMRDRKKILFCVNKPITVKIP